MVNFNFIEWHHISSSSNNKKKNCIAHTQTYREHRNYARHDKHANDNQNIIKIKSSIENRQTERNAITFTRQHSYPMFNKLELNEEKKIGFLFLVKPTTVLG